MRKTQTKVVKSLADIATRTMERASTDPRTPEGAETWVKEMVRIHHGRGPTQVKALFTPAIANALLARNPDNRTKSKTVVAEFEWTMRDGDWDGLNGETIKISECGLLNDGQSRCQALARAGVSFPQLFVFGLPRESRLTLDQGRKRLAGDFLKMQGLQESRYVAGVAQLIYQWRKNGRIVRAPAAADRVSGSRIAKYAIEHHDEFAAAVAAVPRRNAELVGGVMVLAACYVMFSEIDRDAALNYIERLVDGSNLSPDSPIATVRQRFQTAAHNRQRLSRGERVEIIVRGWNAIREGRRLAKLPIIGNLPKLVTAKHAHTEAA